MSKKDWLINEAMRQAGEATSQCEEMREEIADLKRQLAAQVKRGDRLYGAVKEQWEDRLSDDASRQNYIIVERAADDIEDALCEYAAGMERGREILKDQRDDNECSDNRSTSEESLEHEYDWVPVTTEHSRMECLHCGMIYDDHSADANKMVCNDEVNDG